MCWVFELSENYFPCHCHHSGCFQPEVSPSLARAVGLERLTRSGPRCSPVSQQLFQVSVATDNNRMKSLVYSVGADKACTFLLVVTCPCVFSLGSCSEPQESEYIWITIKLLWITDYFEKHIWTWSLNIYQKNYKVQENCTQHMVVAPLHARTENREALYVEEL